MSTKQTASLELKAELHLVAIAVMEKTNKQKKKHVHGYKVSVISCTLRRRGGQVSNPEVPPSFFHVMLTLLSSKIP